MASTRRVLLVGWDSADWRLLRPLMDAAAMPHLSSLVATGVHGNLRTLQPQFSPLLWTSIATGRRASEHGVLNILVPDSNTGTHPLSRMDRSCKCLWNILTDQQRPSIVINWPATYPAEPVLGSCISDMFTRLAGTPKGLEPVAPSATYPESLSETLEELRLLPTHLTREELNFFVPDVEKLAAENDPVLARLSVVLAETLTTHGIALEQLEQQPWDLAMVRYATLDALGPQFMACHPPQLPYIPDELFERHKGVITAVCRYLDLMLGRLMELVGPDTTVILVSERGIHCDHLRPQDPEVAFRHEGSPWYREQGILAMAGPDLSSDATVQGAGLLDIAPTVLQTLGIPVGRDMPGRVLVEAFSKPPRPDDIPSHEQTSAGNEDDDGHFLSPEETTMATRRWRELGLLSDEGIQSSEVISSAGQQRNFNLAMVELDARRPKRALRYLEGLHNDMPGDDRIALHLARCRRRTGDLDGARDIFERVVDHPDQRPLEQMQLAQLNLALGDPDKALLALFRAEQAEGERPGVHCQIGETYLFMQRWDEAERAFSKALERDADHAASHRGLAATRMAQQRHVEAAESALRAVELDRNHPFSHYYLGAALAGNDQIEIAVQVFLTCLELDENHLGAHRGLTDAYEKLGYTREAGEHREKVKNLESVALMHSQLRELRR